MRSSILLQSETRKIRLDFTLRVDSPAGNHALTQYERAVWLCIN